MLLNLPMQETGAVLRLWPRISHLLGGDGPAAGSVAAEHSVSHNLRMDKSGVGADE
jgi:hypothetical protein